MNPAPLSGNLLTRIVTYSGFTLTTQATYELIRSCIRSPSVTVSKTYTGVSGEVRTTYTRVDAPAIAVIWRNGDFPTLTTSAITSTTNGTVPEPDDSTNPPPPPAHGAPTTTIAVATVVPIVVIAMIILGFFIYRRRARPSPAPPFPEIGGNDIFQISGTQLLPAPIELQTYQSQTSLSPSRPPATGVAPAVVTLDEGEVQVLQSRREQVRKHRERLVRLQALDVEDRELEEMINERTGGGRA